mmetsp:Transcript_1367/g.6084  ORF Transcript_1367/g.6084 Transcript_1367/m.6084 type:complete len:241 (-) Transcript_1367:1138-1860(-)
MRLALHIRNFTNFLDPECTTMLETLNLGVIGVFDDALAELVFSAPERLPLLILILACVIRERAQLLDETIPPTAHPEHSKQLVNAPVIPRRLVTPWAGCVKVLLGNCHLRDPRSGHFKCWFPIHLGRFVDVPFFVHINLRLLSLRCVVHGCVLTRVGRSLNLRGACILRRGLTGSCLTFCVLLHDRYLYLLDTSAHRLPLGRVLEVSVQVPESWHLPNGPWLYVHPEVPVIPQILQTEVR